MSLKIGVIQTPPMSTHCALDVECSTRGYGVDTLNFICHFLNLNCTFVWYSGIEYGSADENGTGNGLIGAVQRGEFDATLPLLTPTYDRFLAVAFSKTYFYLDVVLVTRAPNQKFNYFDWRFLYAFQWPVVVVFFLSLFSIAALISFGTKIQGDRPELRDQILVFLDNCASLVTQNFNRNISKFKPFHIVLSCWGLVTLVLCSSYTGILFHQKVSSSVNYPFTDLETFVQCLEIKKCSLIMPTLSISYYLMLTAPGNILTDRMNKAFSYNPVLIKSQKEILTTILREENVYLVWLWSKEEIFYGSKDEEISLYHWVDTPLKERETIAVRKNSPLLASLSKMALVFRESGLAEAFRSKYAQPSLVSNAKGANVWDGEQLASVGTIFYLYGIGIFVALISFTFELRDKYFKTSARQTLWYAPKMDAP